MANILQSRFSNTMVACITTVAFTTATLAPPPLIAGDVNLDFNAINFGIKIEKMYEKVKKCINKGETNKIVAYMFDFKTEVEHYTGQKIDINKYIDQTQKEAKAQGQKVDDKYVKAIRKEFVKHDKIRKHRAVWFAQCVELGIPYSSFEADATFESNYTMTKSAKGNKNDVNVEDVPIPIMVGITVTLAGLFLVFVPIPVCQTAGVWLINTGFSILGGDALQRWDAYDKDQKEKK